MGSVLEELSDKLGSCLALVGQQTIIDQNIDEFLAFWDQAVPQSISGDQRFLENLREKTREGNHKEEMASNSTKEKESLEFEQKLKQELKSGMQQSTEHEVTINLDQVSRPKIVLKPGESIRWKIGDSPDPGHHLKLYSTESDGERHYLVDSGPQLIRKYESFQWQFDSSGSYILSSDIYPSMTQHITVKGAPEPSTRSNPKSNTSKPTKLSQSTSQEEIFSASNNKLCDDDEGGSVPMRHISDPGSVSRRVSTLEEVEEAIDYSQQRLRDLDYAYEEIPQEYAAASSARHRATHNSDLTSSFQELRQRERTIETLNALKKFKRGERLTSYENLLIDCSDPLRYARSSYKSYLKRDAAASSQNSEEEDDSGDDYRYLSSKADKASTLEGATVHSNSALSCGSADREAQSRGRDKTESGGGTSKCMKCQRGFLNNMSRQRHQRICPGKRGVLGKMTTLSEQHKRQLREWVDQLLLTEEGKEKIQGHLRNAWEELDTRLGVSELWNALDDVLDVSEEGSKKYIRAGQLLRNKCVGKPSDLTTYTALEQFLVYCSEGTYLMGDNLLGGGVKWESGDVDIIELPGLLAAQVEHNLWGHFMEARTKEVNELQQKLMAEESSKVILNSKTAKLSPTKPKKKKRTFTKTKLLSGNPEVDEISDDDTQNHDSQNNTNNEQNQPNHNNAISTITLPQKTNQQISTTARNPPTQETRNVSSQNFSQQQQEVSRSDNYWESYTATFTSTRGKYGASRYGRGGRGYRGGHLSGAVITRRGTGRSSQGYYWSGSTKPSSYNNNNNSNTNSYNDNNYHETAEYSYRRRPSADVRHARDVGNSTRGGYGKKWVETSQWKQRKVYTPENENSYNIQNQVRANSQNESSQQSQQNQSHQQHHVKDADVEADNPFKAFKQPSNILTIPSTSSGTSTNKQQNCNGMIRVQSSPRSLVGGNQDPFSPRNHANSDPSITPRSQQQQQQQQKNVQNVQQRVSYASILSRAVQGGQESVTDSTELDQPEMFPELVQHPTVLSQDSFENQSNSKIVESSSIDLTENISSLKQDNEVTQSVQSTQNSLQDVQYISSQGVEFNTQQNPLFAPPPPSSPLNQIPPVVVPLQDLPISPSFQEVHQTASNQIPVVSPNQEVQGDNQSCLEGGAQQLQQQQQQQTQQYQQQQQPIRYPIPLGGVQPGVVPQQHSLQVPLSTAHEFVPSGTTSAQGLPMYQQQQNQVRQDKDWMNPNMMYVPNPHIQYMPPRANLLPTPHFHPHPHPHATFPVVPPPPGFHFKDHNFNPNSNFVPTNNNYNFQPFPQFPEFHPSVQKVEKGTQISDTDNPTDTDNNSETQNSVQYRDEGMQTGENSEHIEYVEHIEQNRSVHDAHALHAPHEQIPENLETDENQQQTGWFANCVRNKLKKKCQQQQQLCEGDEIRSEGGSGISDFYESQDTVYFKDDCGSVLDPYMVQSWLAEKLRFARSRTYMGNVENEPCQNQLKMIKSSGEEIGEFQPTGETFNAFFTQQQNMLVQNNNINNSYQVDMGVGGDDEYFIDYYYEDENNHDLSMDENCDDIDQNGGHHYYENMVYNPQHPHHPPQFQSYPPWPRNDSKDDNNTNLNQQYYKSNLQQQWQNYHSLPSYPLNSYDMQQYNFNKNPFFRRSSSSSGGFGLKMRGAGVDVSLLAQRKAMKWVPKQP